MSKSKETFFSVVIPTFNMESFLRKSIKSVLNQNYKNFEIIVIDNFSKDNTKKLVKNFKNKKIKFFQINNGGVIGKSRNLGIKKSKGNWIAFLDADDMWFKNRLSVLKKKIENKNFDFISSSEIIEVQYNKTKKIWHYGFKKNNNYEKFLRFGSVFSTSASVIKKEFITRKKILFSEKKIFASFEDFDFFLNMAKNSAKFFFLRKVLGRHLFHHNSTTEKKKNYEISLKAVIKSHVKKQNFEKNKIKLFNEIIMYQQLKKNIENTIKKKNIFTNIIEIFYHFIINPVYFFKIINILLSRQLNHIVRLN
jgi:glycosyltransferase involved in cell wall biosynthesis